MSGPMMEDEDLLNAAEYALSIVRRTEELATADGLDAEYQAALATLTAYVKALQTASMSSRRKRNAL
jgi:hypothetical protein